MNVERAVHEVVDPIKSKVGTLLWYLLLLLLLWFDVAFLLYL